MNLERKSNSLRSLIFVRIAPIACLALLAIIVFSSYRVSATLLQEIQRRVNASAIHAARQTELKLVGMIEACHSVSVNDMVVNGIVDLEHRNTTLQSYFRSLQLPGPRNQQATMTDYKGRVLASTSPNATDCSDAVWFSDVMSGKQFVGVEGQSLTIALPVLYSNQAEGVIAATFAVKDFLATQSASSDVNALVFHDSGSVIYSTDPNLVSDQIAFTPPSKWLIATSDVVGLGDLQVSFLESRDTALSAANTVTNSQLVQLAVLIAGLLSIIWLASRLVTKPLESLLDQIAAIRNTRNLSLRVEETGPREFVELGKGFNAMLGEVQRTTVSQEEYRVSEERLAVAIQGTNDGLWDWDLESDVIWYAPGYKKLLGYEDSETEFPNQLETFKEHLHPDDNQATWDAIENHIKHDAKFDLEQRIRTRQGAYRWFRARAAGSRNEAGKMIRMAGSIQDITERKTFEQALRRSNQDLEQFAYIASHDLQEPLRKVASFCGLLRQDYWERFDEEGRQYLDFAIDGATRMRSLVQDLLRYSKIGSERNRSHEIDPEAALQLAIQNLEEAITQSDAKITHDPLPKLMAESREIAQLLQNLIGNAIKYRNEESPIIHIGVISCDEFWQFSVADNGIGVAPEYRERIFGIFKRLHSRNEYPGTGIGLAICKRIIDQLGGRIWVEESPKPGCTICFTIPKQPSIDPTHIYIAQSEGLNNEHVAVE